MMQIKQRSSSASDSALEAQLAAALSRCAGGDRTALRVIFDCEGARMVGVARRMLRRQELAEEAVQETFMRIWRAAATFDSQKGAARTWIYAIVRNCALSILRDEKRSLPDEGYVEDGEEAAVLRLPEESALRRCLEQLEAPRRSVIVLAYVHGLSHGELAGRLRVPLGTVKSWLRRSLVSLQGCMG